MAEEKQGATPNNTPPVGGLGATRSEPNPTIRVQETQADRWIKSALFHHNAGRKDDAEISAYEAGQYGGKLPPQISGITALRESFNKGAADAPLDAEARNRADALADAGFDPFAKTLNEARQDMVRLLVEQRSQAAQIGSDRPDQAASKMTERIEQKTNTSALYAQEVQRVAPKVFDQVATQATKEKTQSGPLSPNPYQDGKAMAKGNTSAATNILPTQAKQPSQLNSPANAVQPAHAPTQKARSRSM